MADEDQYPDADELLEQIEDSTRTAFDALEVGTDERDHTRVLNWLLDPTQNEEYASDSASEGATPFFEALLRESDPVGDDGDDKSPEIERVVETRRFSRAGNAEFDIVLAAEMEDGSEQLFDIEIKTIGSLGSAQAGRQAEVLEEHLEELEDDDDDSDQNTSSIVGSDPTDYQFLYLAPSDRTLPTEGGDEEIIDYRVDWRDVCTAARSCVEYQPTEVANWVQQWTNFLDTTLTKSEGFSPSAKLWIAHPEEAEEKGIDKKSFKPGRERLFRSYTNWAMNSDVFDDTDEWKWYRGNTRKQFHSPDVNQTHGTMGLARNSWPWEDGQGESIRFRVLAKSTRPRKGESYGGGHDAYRTDDAHVELTVAHTVDDTHDLGKRRQELHERLDNALGGTPEVEDGTAEFQKCCAHMKKHNSNHAYAKQILLFDSDRTDNCLVSVSKELREGTETLVEQAAPVIDEYVRDNDLER